jgi:hypothetical protein
VKDRIRDRELLRTNPFGAERAYRVGAVVKVEGRQWRITRHKLYPTTPDATIVVYGVPA